MQSFLLPVVLLQTVIVNLGTNREMPQIVLCFYPPKTKIYFKYFQKMRQHNKRHFLKMFLCLQKIKPLF
ncbi:MAG TPA: hypothetical protein DCS93_08875 [Microscillaceae bacterium]|nr:hypothetical protein [Microscillaceae bacterium]